MRSTFLGMQRRIREKIQMKNYFANCFEYKTSAVLGFSIMLIFSIFAPFVAAQTSGDTSSTEPTLQESLDFIKGKVNVSGCSYGVKDSEGKNGVKFNSFRHPRHLTFDGKEGKFNLVYEAEIFGEMSDGSILRNPTISNEDYQFHLENLSETNLKVSDMKEIFRGKLPQYIYTGDCFQVEVHTYNDEKKIIKKESLSKKNEGQGKTEEEKTNVMHFYFDDKDVANRIIKAFSNAIKLSGGKKKSF